MMSAIAMNDIRDSAYQQIKDLIKREIGLDALTVGDSTISKIISMRMNACHVGEIDTYLNFLKGNQFEINELLETAVIPETWFFRDARPFEVIRQRIRHHQSTSRVRILCLPCATGEEPYSLAMFLMSANIPVERFEIIAADISQRAIDIAINAIYTSNSFRGDQVQEYLDLYFHKETHHYRVSEKVTQQVNFHPLNILNHSQLDSLSRFDFILCRNLLIYFDDPTKCIAFRHLHDMLQNDGMLFIGHSEFGRVPRDLFVTLQAEQAFGLIKQTSPLVKQSPQNRSSAKQKKTSPVTQLKMPAQSVPRPFANVESTTAAHKQDSQNTPEQPVQNNKNLLQRAQQLADQGNLGEAESLCYEFLDNNEPHSDAFCLLGIISETENNQQLAESFYRKALYLDPRHYDALVHLALIADARGDSRNAKLLRDRAQRAAGTQQP